MQNTRFNDLLSGALHHPVITFQITRLVMALQFVVQETGEAGEKALEEWCRQREEQDNHEDRT